METLLKYENACNELARTFLEALYPDEPEYYDDWYWIADEIGGCVSWDDWFVNPNSMADYFRYKYTPDEFFKWYDKWVENEGALNMKNFKKTFN